MLFKTSIGDEIDNGLMTAWVLEVWEDLQLNEDIFKKSFEELDINNH